MKSEDLSPIVMGAYVAVGQPSVRSDGDRSSEFTLQLTNPRGVKLHIQSSGRAPAGALAASQMN